MTFNERVIELAKLIGSDINELTNHMGDLNSLETDEKANLITAINEIHRKTFSNTGTDILISSDENNIITKKINGLYAYIDSPQDISDFINAIDTAIN